MIDLRPNIYALYHLNEELGNTAYDSSGNGRNGTLVNMEDTDWVAGKLNNCLQFDGVNEYVNCGNIAYFERNLPFSYECWFNTTSSALLMVMAKMGSAINGPLLYLNSGKIYWALYSVSSCYASIHTNGLFNNGILHHLIVTTDGTSLTSGMNIYVDGFLNSVVVDKNNLNNTILNDDDFMIGSRVLSPRANFTGKIDEVVIYDKELSQEEVNFRWNNGEGREDFFEGPAPAAVTFTVKDTLGNHLNNIGMKIGSEDWITVNSPFDLDITGHTDILFDKGGYKVQSKHIEAEEHIENIVLDYLVDSINNEVGKHTWYWTTPGGGYK